MNTLLFREVQHFDAAVRWIVRRLRLWLDVADERVHAWEMLTRKESVTAATASPGKVGQPIESAEAKLGESRNRNKKTPGVQLLRPRSRVGNPAGHGHTSRRRRITATDFDQRSRERLHDLANDFESAWSRR